MFCMRKSCTFVMYWCIPVLNYKIEIRSMKYYMRYPYKILFE